MSNTCNTRGVKTYHIPIRKTKTHTHKKENISLNESMSTSYVKSKRLQRTLDADGRLQH